MGALPVRMAAHAPVCELAGSSVHATLLARAGII